MAYAIDPPLDPGTGPLVRPRELTAGAPSSLFDESPDGLNASSTHPCGAWEEQILADYLQCLIFEGTASDVAAAEPRAALTIAALASPTAGTLRFDLWSAGHGTARIDLLHADGRSARQLGEVVLTASGPTSLRYSIDGLSSGVYFLRVRDARQAVARKLLVVR
ncbi:MAG: T9SS type A sorting domain-containing protein [Candidatus Eisenbacteria bacterium]